MLINVIITLFAIDNSIYVYDYVDFKFKVVKINRYMKSIYFII